MQGGGLDVRRSLVIFEGTQHTTAYIGAFDKHDLSVLKQIIEFRDLR